MARLSYPDPEQLSDEARRVLSKLPGLHIFQMLAHAQTALRPTMLLGRAILAEQELAPHLRETAILEVAKQAEADYEWTQHVPIARAAGVTDEQISFIEQGIIEVESFDRRMKLVRYLAKEVAAGPHLSDETFAALHAHFTPREIVELLLTIGYYMMLGRLMTVLDIDPDTPAGNIIVEGALKSTRR